MASALDTCLSNAMDSMGKHNYSTSCGHPVEDAINVIMKQYLESDEYNSLSTGLNTDVLDVIIEESDIADLDEFISDVITFIDYVINTISRLMYLRYRSTYIDDYDIKMMHTLIINVCYQYKLIKRDSTDRFNTYIEVSGNRLFDQYSCNIRSILSKIHNSIKNFDDMSTLHEYNYCMFQEHIKVLTFNYCQTVKLSSNDRRFNEFYLSIVNVLIM